MSKNLMSSILAVLVFATLLLAHGDATHIMGTVTAIDGNHLTVMTQAGKSEMVMLEKGTKYLNGPKAATAADLKVGTRVVIDAKMDPKMKMYSATEVRIGVATPVKADSKAKSASPANAHTGHK